MRNKVISEALKWVGYLEKKSNSQLEIFTANAGSKNYTIFAKWYKDYWNENYQAQPWCAMFVSCVFRDALGTDAQKKLMPNFSYCPTGVNQFKKIGCWITSNPQIGDVIFFKNTSNVPCHVGIVYKVDSKNVYTVEGNTSSVSGVVENGGCVAKKSYALNYNRIIGYGRPKYENVSKPSTNTLHLISSNNLASLVSKGAIKSPEYWEKTSLLYLNELCANAIPKLNIKADNKITDFDVAIKLLTDKKIMSSPDYWIQASKTVKYLDQLIINIANKCV